MKIIKVEDKTHQRLLVLGKKAETFDQIINRILDHVWRNKKIK